jgi:tetratricopeptide (TPR) repeat protein
MYQRVLELDPANEGAQAFLAIGYAGLGKCREAVTAGEAYVSRFGKSGDVLEFMGMSYQCLGDFERAKQYYEVRSDFTEARLFLAALYRQEGEADKSRAILLQATEALYKEIQAHPENAFTRSALVCGYGMLGNRELMSAEEPRLLMDNPDNGMVLAMLGWAHAAIGDNDRAVELLRGALRKGSRQQLRCFPCLENLGAEGLRKSPAYQQFVKELEGTERRLRALY